MCLTILDNEKSLNKILHREMDSPQNSDSDIQGDHKRLKEEEMLWDCTEISKDEKGI